MDKEYILGKLKRFCGFLTGIVFYISGILKLMDPVGAGLVMNEYFSFLHLGFLDFSARFCGTALAFAETVIGAALITGVWRKVTVTAACSIQAFFTILTLLLVIINPEMDCGCFGEAVHLTHAQTFIKNLILLALLACYSFPMRKIGEPRKRKYASFGIVTLSTAAFMIYSLMYIPLVDFTDYRTAASIKPDIGYETEDNQYEAVFIYEKDGRQETFDLQSLPDSTWTFVRTETTMNNGLHDKMTPLSIIGSDGTYLDHLAYDGKVMVVSIYDPDLSSSRWEKICRFVTSAQETGFRVLILAAGTPEGVTSLIPEEMRDCIEPHIHYSDYKTLITLNRSNGGVTLFSDGYLIRKWAARTAPDLEELREAADTSETEIIIGQSSQGSLSLQGFLLYVFAVMLLL